jgi:hypothetical protein
MKRGWIGVILALYSSLSFVLFNAPAASANASGTCGGTAVGCVVLHVDTYPNTPGATVTATRQATSNTDNNFTLSPLSGSPGSYTSGGTIFGTNPDSTACSSSPLPRSVYFDITVADSSGTIGTLKSVNMCYNSSPAADASGIKTVSVPIGGVGQPYGGISGTFLVSINGSAPTGCPATNNHVDVEGTSSNDQVPLTAGGKFNTGYTLKPSTKDVKYTVTLNCIYGGYTTHFVIRDVVVNAGGITVLKAASCDPIKSQGDEWGCVAAGSGPPDNGASTNDHGVHVPATCYAGQFFNWLICGSIHHLLDAIDWIRENIIVPFLHEEPLEQTIKNSAGKNIQNPTYTIWSGFRNIASIFFILVFFLIIFGTAIGWDNYTVKKVLPRLVAGAVLVPFSWYVCVAVIDIGNVIGQGLVALIAPLIPPPGIDFSSSLSKTVLSGALVGATLAAGAALASVGWGVIVSMLLAFLGVLFTLVLRKVLITLLVVLSPFAFLAWILPNTEKWYSEWWSNLFKLVMMYPIIVLLFEAGRLFAATAGASSGTTFDRGVIPIFQLVGLTLPLFGVPLAFKWAGSGLAVGQKMLGKVRGGINNRYGKDSDRAKEAAERRKLNNARKSLDDNNNRIGLKRKGLGFDSKALGAVKRGVYLKRSGLGGFFGRSNIPGLRNNASQKQRINAAEEKYEAEQSQSRAQDQMRAQNPQTRSQRFAAGKAVQLKKLLNARADEAALVKDESGQSIAAADVTNAEQLAWLKERARTGDAAVQIAVLRRFAKLPKGIEAAMELRTGEKYLYDDTELTTDATAIRNVVLADGTVVRDGDTVKAGSVIKSGGYVNENANEIGSSGPYNMGETRWKRGDFDDNTVSDANRTVWDEGMGEADVGDTVKPLVAAARDNAAGDVAGMTAFEARRYIDYYERNAGKAEADHAAAEFFKAFADAEQNSELNGRIYDDTRKIINEARARRGGS